MLKFAQRLRNAKDEKGASAVEYGLLVALIAALIVAVVWGLGSLVKDAFNETCKGITGANASIAATSGSCG